MLVQREIEEKLTALLTSAFTGSDVSISSTWATAATGMVHWVESEEAHPILVNVTVSSPSRQTFSAPNISLGVAISVVSRTELDPTAGLFNAACETVQGLVDQWQSETYQAQFTRLDTSSVSIDEIVNGGGVAPQLQNAFAVATYNFTLYGSYLTSN